MVVGVTRFLLSVRGPRPTHEDAIISGEPSVYLKTTVVSYGVVTDSSGFYVFNTTVGSDDPSTY